MSNYKLITTPKLEGQTKTLVRQAAAKQNPGYRVASVGVTEDGSEWEVRLEVTSANRVSNRTRQAAPPPFEKKDDSKDDASDDDEGPSDDDSDEDSPAEGDTDDGDSDTEGDTDAPKGKGKKNPSEEVKRVIGELQKLLGELQGHTDSLQAKADKVDEIHDLAAPDVDKMEPVPPIDGPAAVGPTPGGPGGPVPPRKPPVPSGNAPRQQVGVPAFGKRQTHVVEHPISDEDGTYSFEDFVSAIKGDPRFVDYDLVETKKLEADNVYVASLKLKQD